MIAAYIEAGWKLTAIPPREKGPRHMGWNLPENALKSEDQLPGGWNVGLMHSLSGTAALDIDNYELAGTYPSGAGAFMIENNAHKYVAMLTT